ncbi:hypothetical protein CLOM_g18042 [Closterium sp. NIES-68]|nr:hypothetical protein CLOM_g18042 [Closterium sp. NIES-68]
MHKHHGFFIPDMEFLTDLQGMLQYLAAKVTQGLMCLWCDDRSKQFSSVEAVRAHMEAKSHGKLRYGDGSGIAEEELEDFYDFSKRYGLGRGFQQKFERLRTSVGISNNVNWNLPKNVPY